LSSTTSLHEHSCKAMNTEIYVGIVVPQEKQQKQPKQVMQYIQDLFTSTEKALSRFNPTSELSRCNEK